MGIFSNQVKVETTPQEPITDLPAHKVGGNSTIVKPSTLQAEPLLEDFIADLPQATYYIDSSRNADESLLCRQKQEGGQTCIKLAYDYAQLFKTMQLLNFFCALPVHKVEAQYFECKKI